jgi:ubiquinol-cytochrome c reductase cytochrome b subunit
VRRLVRWFEERLQLQKLLGPSMTHPVPRSSASWWYVFGSATLIIFVLQIATGICLALVYVPSTADAHASLEYLNYQQTLGWFLRAVHFWGSNFMVAMMSLHMIQVFLFGAYKYPRELTWVVGVFLFLCTLGMAFTGQVLRWDQDAYWGLGIGVAMIGRVPLIGAQLVHLVTGGPIIGAETLSRFFAMHVFVIPGLLLGLVGLHLLMVLKLGINEWPMPGRLVARDTYRERYEAEVKRDGVPFFPVAAEKDMVFGGIVILAILACAALLGPDGPNGPADPTLIRTVPRPDFYFLSLFALFALLPPYTETFLILVGPVVAIALLIALPFLAGTGEKSFKRRPVAVVSVVLILLVLGVLTYLGAKAPWSPAMDAWSGVPTPVNYVLGRSPLQLQGAVVFQSKQCRNCHSLGGQGGARGPALDGIASRMTRDLLIRQVLQGGGNMPAYGKNLSPAEVTALVSFLDTLRSPRDAAARSPVPPPRVDR